MEKKRISVIGLGYIGLPTAALLAYKDYEVFGIDLNLNIVNTINQGCAHIVEPELDAYVSSAVAKGKLKAFSSIKEADVYIICVPTPFHETEDIPQPNIDYVLAAANSIKDHVKSGDLIILESTSPVGTTEKINQIFIDSGVDADSINVAYCPERVLPGNIMQELTENDRIVGGLSERATKVVSNFYRNFVKGKVLETNAAVAEMCKLAENSFRDVNIAFANELSILCANAGIDVWRLIDLANHHPRVNILQPGVGVGGHCIAVDPWFIVASDPDNAKLIRSAREVNIYKTEWVLRQIKEATSQVELKKGSKAKLACLGMSFKQDIDDLRESPAMQVILTLQNQGYNISVVEPNVTAHDFIHLIDLDKAIADFDLLVILVRHKEFIRLRELTLNKSPLVLDFCGLT